MINNVIKSIFKTGEGPSSSPVQFRVDGKPAYYIEPVVTKGRLPFNSASIVIKVYKDDSKSVCLPCRIRWYRVYADRNFEIEDLEDSEIFDFSAGDIGSEIKAVLKPKVLDHGVKQSGCTVTFGPVRFDPNIRPPLESVLLSGFSKFNVMVDLQNPEMSGTEGGEPISVFISQNQIKFFYHSLESEESFFIELNNKKPTLEVPSNEIERITIKFDQICYDNGQSAFLDDDEDDQNQFGGSGTGNSKVKSRRNLEDRQRESRDFVEQLYQRNTEGSEKYKMTIRFFSRNSRDIFLISCKLFRIVPVVSLSSLFRQIDVLLRENRLFEGASQVTMNELLVEHDLLRSSLLNTIEYVKELDTEKDELQACMIVLEKDLKTTIDEYKRLLNENVENQAAQNQILPSQNNQLLPSRAPEKFKRERLENLNRSLLSVQGDLPEKINKRLDLSVSHMRGINGGGGLTNNLGKVSGGVSKFEFKKLQKELQRVKATKDILMKELLAIKSKKKQKKEKIRQQLDQMSIRVDKVNQDLSRVNDTMISKDADLDSRLFNINDMSAIQTVRGDQTMELGRSRQVKKFGSILQNDTANVGGLEDNDRSGMDMSKSRIRNSRMVDEIKIESLQKEMTKMTNTLNDLKISNNKLSVQLEQSNKRANENLKLGKELRESELEDMKMQNEVLEKTITELQSENVRDAQLLLDFRKKVGSLIETGKMSQADQTQNNGQTLLDSSMTDSILGMDASTQNKLLNLENEGLSKKVGSLQQEVAMLRTEINSLRKGDIRMSMAGSMAHQKEVEVLRKDLTGVIAENQNLRDLLNKIKATNAPLDVDTVVKKLKDEVKQLRNMNLKMIDDMKKRQENSLSGDTKGEQNSPMIIEQLSKTNERLMGEVMRLQEQVQAFEDAKMSFISDSMNESYLNNSLASGMSVLGK